MSGNFLAFDRQVPCFIYFMHAQHKLLIDVIMISYIGQRPSIVSCYHCHTQYLRSCVRFKEECPSGRLSFFTSQYLTKLYQERVCKCNGSIFIITTLACNDNNFCQSCVSSALVNLIGTVGNFSLFILFFFLVFISFSRYIDRIQGTKTNIACFKKNYF